MKICPISQAHLEARSITTHPTVLGTFKRLSIVTENIAHFRCDRDTACSVHCLEVLSELDLSIGHLELVSGLLQSTGLYLFLRSLIFYFLILASLGTLRRQLPDYSF